MSCKSFAAARLGQRVTTQITDSRSSRTSKISMADIEHLCDPGESSWIHDIPSISSGYPVC